VWAAVSATAFCNTTAELGSNMQCIDLKLVSVCSSQSLMCDKGVLSEKVKVKVKVTDVSYFATAPLPIFLTFNYGTDSKASLYLYTGRSTIPAFCRRNRTLPIIEHDANMYPAGSVFLSYFLNRSSSWCFHSAVYRILISLCLTACMKQFDKPMLEYSFSQHC
jgi:hypothetical protein